MADPHIPPEGWSVVFWLMGGGSVGGIAIALIGKIRGAKPAEPPVSRVEVETPWMVQNLLEMKLEIEATKKMVEALTTLISNLTIQVSTVSALLGRRRRNRRKAS